MKSSTSRTFFILTILYLVIEAQALVSLVSIYTTSISANNLANLEQIGYVTAALGLTLLASKFIRQFDIKAVAMLMMAPLIYVCSFEVVHGIVERLPMLIVDKPAALRAGVMTLSNPSFSNAGEFWLQRDNNNAISHQAASEFNSRFKVKDAMVQAVYSDALNNLNRFHSLYRQETKDLTREKIRTMRVKTSQALYAQGAGPVSYNSAINTLAYERYLMSKIPLLWGINIASSEGLATFNPVLSDLVDTVYQSYPDSAQWVTPENAPLKQIDKYYVMERMLHQQVWNKWRDIMPYLGPYPAGQQAFEDKFVAAVTAHYITPLTGDTRPIPLSKTSQATYFNTQAERIAPFFFNQGSPIISLAKVYDYETRKQYTENLSKGLHPTLRQAFDDYRVTAIKTLSSNKEAWSRPIDRELNIDLVRVGAILPVMLLLSVTLVAMNLFLSYALVQERLLLVTAFLVGCGLALTPVGDILKEGLLLLSYRMPQVFLS